MIPEVKMIFIGGNERQARFSRDLARELEAEGLDVTFVHPGFVRNWQKPLEAVKRMLPEVSAIVVTSDVPTLLGREVHRCASHAGIYCRKGARARGQGGTRQLILEAAEVVRRQAA